MASLEVGSAVAAVVSAFHGGADLVKQIRKKSKSSKSNVEKAIKEKMLQETLETGEAQISEKYSTHFQELGSRFQTGDGKGG
jgi:hypothetical protein